ncbi:dockerin type I domain-containing protein [uncultured Ruminococcus sp.]|uniref:dockerin type I domain-containing protein n=1 Tax=uncultured Ruminococcus sp. TaxID=165186 RepID=UPI0025E7FD9C|nr:dockerin type I domain-containing protein [uncultured Ruminococcus sp.]
MKSTRKAISVILAVLMLITCVSVSFTVNASTGTLCDKYATNPQGKIGVKKTITIDGSYSDWSSDMLIAQGAAWDVANHYKGGHENCVLDTYALYAAWDDNNLYVAWQMVNTTDTWAREGDGPLSDGGRVLDVPLILALSVDPSSTSMSNKNTNGDPIWGRKMGLTFNQHVDHLLYMSGKVGNGTPGMFTAVDEQGNTNYTNGLKTFKDNGIEYKMAEGNVCDSIIGLNYSEDTSDVYSNDADWVDYKTFKGSSGTHNTKYDSFYEIKIPLSTLGINSSYIENNGLGAMVVATRGESGLDCIPFDDTMLDNATGSYGSDASTSHEKDDEDVITSSFARIGNLGGDVPVTQPTTVKPTTQPTTAKPTTQPTTAKPTTQPTTAKPTTQPTTAKTTTTPVSNTLTVNAKSNLFSTNSVKADSNAKTVTVTYDLQSSMKLVNGQWSLSYDNTKLKLVSTSNDLMPNVTDSVVNCMNGIVKGNFTNVTTLYDFTSSKPFVKATFEIIGSGSTDVTLNVQELSVGYKSNNSLVYKNAVVNSVKQDLSGISGFESSSITGSASAVTDVQPTTVLPTQTTTAKPTQATTQQPTTVPSSLTVNATSNFFPAASKTYSSSEKQVTVSYKLSSAMKLINSEWELEYDTSKLSFNSANIDNLMPNVSSAVIYENTKGKIKGNFTTASLVDFSNESDFVSITFDVIGKGTADVNLFVKVLGVAYKKFGSTPTIAYVVDFGEIKDVTSIPGFEKETYTVKTVFDPQTTPTTVPVTTNPTVPTTKPTEPTTKPTEPTTVPVTDTLKVNATSNILPPVSQEYDKDTSTVTVSYKLTSSMKFVNSQWCLTYDSSKLSYDPQKNSDGVMPNVSSAVINTDLNNRIKGGFSSLSLYDFTTEKDFVTVTFDIIGTGETTIDLDIEILGVAYKDRNFNVIKAYPVDDSKFIDITSTPGFENMKLSGRITLNEPTEHIFYGDVNYDGVVNVADATLVQKHAANIVKLTDDQIKRADVNFDGAVNIQDSTLICKFAVGIISSFK